MYGTVDDMLRDFQSVTDYTENGKCSNCGQCCSDVLPVSDREVTRIWKFVRSNGIREEKINPPLFYPAAINLICPFRNEMKRRCNIYPVRPLICRDFQCNKGAASADKDLANGTRHVISMRKTFFEK